jgi:hypothetical protein
VNGVDYSVSGGFLLFTQLLMITFVIKLIADVKKVIEEY